MRHGVEPVEEFAGIRAAQLQLAERRDVEQADAFAHGHDLVADRLLRILGIAVEIRPPPGADRLHHGVEREVPGVQRRAPLQHLVMARKHAERLRADRRTRGGDADFGYRPVGRLGDDPCRRQRRMAALARPHADRGEALDQLDLAIAILDGVVQILDLQILVEIDEVAAFRIGHDRLHMDRAGWFDFAEDCVLYNRMAKPLQC